MEKQKSPHEVGYLVDFIEEILEARPRVELG
jgi:hypothetical protein